jgi:hypothetical protein
MHARARACADKQYPIELAITLKVYIPQPQPCDHEFIFVPFRKVGQCGCKWSSVARSASFATGSQDKTQSTC